MLINWDLKMYTFVIEKAILFGLKSKLWLEVKYKCSYLYLIVGTLFKNLVSIYYINSIKFCVGYL